MEKTPIVILHSAELEEVLGGEGALCGVEIHRDVSHASNDEHRHIRKSSGPSAGFNEDGGSVRGEEARRRSGLKSRPSLEESNRRG